MRPVSGFSLLPRGAFVAGLILAAVLGVGAVPHGAGGACLDEVLAWGRYASAAGRGVDEFYTPGQLLVDPAGRLLVLDSYLRRIQVFDDEGRPLRQIPLLDAARGMTIDPAGNFYVAFWDGYVAKLDPEGREILRWGEQGRGPGQFQNPSGVVFDPVTGRVHVADTNRGDVQVFSPDGAFLELWDAWREIRPGSIAMAPDGHLLVSDISAQSIRRLDPQGRLVDTWFPPREEGDAGFGRPAGLAVSVDGELLVADSSRDRVWIFDPATGRWDWVGRLGEEPGDFSVPLGVAWALDGTFYVSESRHTRRVQRVTRRGEPVASIGKEVDRCDGFQWPANLAISEAGFVFVPDSQRIKKFDPEGRLVACWGALGEGPGQFRQPTGVAVGRGRVYVVDRENYRIQIFDEDGRYLTSWQRPEGGRWRFPQWGGIALDGAGEVWVLVRSGSRVLHLDAEGGVAGRFDLQGHGRGLAFGPDGSLYVSFSNSHTIGRYDTAGRLLLEWGGQGMEPGFFRFPSGLAVAPDATVFVADFENSRIQRFDADGVFLGVVGEAGSDPGLMRRPLGVAVWEDFVFVADSNNFRIQRFPRYCW